MSRKPWLHLIRYFPVIVFFTYMGKCFSTFLVENTSRRSKIFKFPALLEVPLNFDIWDIKCVRPLHLLKYNIIYFLVSRSTHSLSFHYGNIKKQTNNLIFTDSISKLLFHWRKTYNKIIILISNVFNSNIPYCANSPISSLILVIKIYQWVPLFDSYSVKVIIAMMYIITIWKKNFFPTKWIPENFTTFIINIFIFK